MGIRNFLFPDGYHLPTDRVLHAKCDGEGLPTSTKYMARLKVPGKQQSFNMRATLARATVCVETSCRWDSAFERRIPSKRTRDVNKM